MSGTAMDTTVPPESHKAPDGVETAVEAVDGTQQLLPDGANLVGHHIKEEEVQGLSPIQIQQEYFENLPDCDWVKYEKKNRNYLLQNIAFALFGSPSLEGELSEVASNEEVKLEGYTSRQREQVMKVYEKICEQSKYSQNDEDVMVSILLIVCARPRPLKFYQMEPSGYWLDLHERTDVDMWCSAVFRVRKCVPTIVGALTCKIFVDENARVYQDWASYLAGNTQPKCVMIVPEHGQYKGTLLEGEESFAVRLTVAPSPSLGLKSRVLSTVDTASTVASLGAVGVLGAAMLTPVGPAAVVGAAVATVATGLYGLVRSSLHLRDRSVHEQSISPTDAEARGSWLNIAASSVGLAAGAASNLLAKSAATGTNLTKTGQALAVSVEVLRHANIVTGGAGVVNSLFHIILKYRKHGEQPSRLELFQFSAATLFFCTAVMSNKTAQCIVEDAQAKTINEYRATLRSNRHRRMFDKISAESRRVQGAVVGNAEVIRGVHTIADKDQYFADVLRINKEVNQHRLRISMTAEGQVNLNSQHRFLPSELSSLGKEGRAQLFTSLGPATVDTRNAITRLTPTTPVGGYIDREDEPTSILVGIRPGEIIRIGTFLVRISSSGAENVAQMLQNLSQDIYVNLMTVTFNVLSKLLPEDIARLRLLSPDEDLIVQITKFVFNYMKHQRPLGEPTREDNGIVMVLKEFFQDGVVRQDTILQLKNSLTGWVEEELDTRRQMYPNKKMIICNSCSGVRFA